MLVRRDLGESGASYLIGRLRNGGVIAKSLAARIKHVDNAFAPLPSNIDEGRISKFKEGGLGIGNSAMNWLVTYVKEKALQESNWTFLVEDTWAKPNDSAILDKRHRALIFEHSVMYALPGKEFNGENVNKLFKSITSFNYAGFISSFMLEDSKTFPTVLEKEFIESFVKKISLFVVDAFDREGVIISEVSS